MPEYLVRFDQAVQYQPDHPKVHKRITAICVAAPTMEAAVTHALRVTRGAGAVESVVDVQDAPDEAVKRLKHKLAAEIAEIVELDVQDQIPKAIERALCWRDPETLQAVKETLQSGAKPKLVGRQSCLFLECGRGKKKVSVML